MIQVELDIQREGVWVGNGVRDGVCVGAVVAVEKSGVLVAVLVGVEKSGVLVAVFVGVNVNVPVAVTAGVLVGTFGTQSI